jgi:hypothetical protein
MMLIIALATITAAGLFGGLGVLFCAERSASNLIIAGTNIVLAFVAAFCNAVLLSI